MEGFPIIKELYFEPVIAIVNLAYDFSVWRRIGKKQVCLERNIKSPKIPFFYKLMPDQKPASSHSVANIGFKPFVKICLSL